ncbi:MAG: DUF2235 domain-containing protein [Bacteroidota bacterium]|nr:DUF2235 domain-containing protein [Bacteroidota bacterium]
MKRIAIFCDGTWNTPDESKDGNLCQTNVVKMANALLPASTDGTAQLLYYDTGIGSEGNLIRRVIDGATGNGISENILQAYRFIINNYEPGDELFFFGFSRGAFTVRSITGLIRNSGILKIANLDQVSRAFSIYRSRKPDLQPRAIEATLFRKTFAVEDVTTIKFIGVWDTVGSLGNPLFLKGILSKSNQFHDTNLSSKINYAFHALAIDEKRKNFEAALWNQQPESTGQVLEQVWFPGVHSDVGGGYPEPETGLSDISLQWMLGKAQSCHLSFGPIALKPLPMAIKHESFTGFYTLQKKNFRPIGLQIPDQGDTNETLHPSVIERYKQDEKYRPINLVDYLKQHLGLL